MRYMIFCACAVLSGCAVIEQIERPATDEAPDGETAIVAPPTTASTVEDFDTTSAEDRAAAAEGSVEGGLLGQAVASLGDPSVPGFWMLTPLVTENRAGRVVLPGTSTGVDVELRPSEPGSARISLAALRVLGTPLTDLVTVDVFEGG